MEYTFNSKLFDEMKVEFMTVLYKLDIDTEEIDDSFYDELKTELKKLCMDEEFITGIRKIHEQNYSNIKANGTSMTRHFKMMEHFSAGDNTLNESAENIIGTIYHIMSLGTIDDMSSDEYMEFEDKVRDVLAVFFDMLPEANKIKKAAMTYGLMLNTSNKMPPNVAAHIASFATGVAPRNNPAYMRNF